jgi:hypothetical protein
LLEQIICDTKKRGSSIETGLIKIGMSKEKFYALFDKYCTGHDI